jgi:hypothetical protein
VNGDSRLVKDPDALKMPRQGFSEMACVQKLPRSSSDGASGKWLLFQHSVVSEDFCGLLNRQRINRMSVTCHRGRLEHRIVYSFLGRLDYRLEQRRHSVIR